MIVDAYTLRVNVDIQFVVLPLRCDILVAISQQTPGTQFLSVITNMIRFQKDHDKDVEWEGPYLYPKGTKTIVERTPKQSKNCG